MADLERVEFEKRFRSGKCPIHGKHMPQLGDLGSGYRYKVRCSEVHCGITAEINSKTSMIRLVDGPAYVRDSLKSSFKLA